MKRDSKSKHCVVIPKEAADMLRNARQGDIMRLTLGQMATAAIMEKYGQQKHRICTELKDKHGTLIYEGDIVENYAVEGVVIFEDGMFTLDKCAKVNFGNHGQPLCYFDELAVIGSIYNDSDLKNLKLRRSGRDEE